MLTIASLPVTCLYCQGHGTFLGHPEDGVCYCSCEAGKFLLFADSDEVDALLDTCCDEALRQTGRRFQVNMMIEESSEWALEGARWQRGGNGRGDRADRPDGIIEETADAKVMVRQMERMFGDAAVDRVFREKIIRLAKILLPGLDAPGHYDDLNSGTRPAP